MNIIYLHVCCINNYREVFQRLLYHIKNSGLYDEVQEIRCCILGNYDKDFFEQMSDPKLKIFKTDPSHSVYEVFTMNIMHNESQTEDCNILYLHTKGVTKPHHANVKDWIELMCYFNIYQYKTCISLLNTYDAVGINLKNTPKVHYSGNFWWSKSSHIKTLPNCAFTCYNAPEFWVAGIKKGNYVCLWESGVDHYKQPYPKELYENHPFTPTTEGV
jgi:hypothetical protein